MLTLFIKKYFKSGMAVHAWNPVLEKLRVES
jgi:hypothetical protein